MITVDLLVGAAFAFFLVLLAAGLTVYFRVKRERSPILMALSGITGMAASLLLLLFRLDVMEIPTFVPITLFILAVLLFISSIIIGWRGRRA